MHKERKAQVEHLDDTVSLVEAEPNTNEILSQVYPHSTSFPKKKSPMQQSMLASATRPTLGPQFSLHNLEPIAVTATLKWHRGQLIRQ